MSYQDDLVSAELAVENEVGQVLSSGQVIADIRSRAQQYAASTNGDVVSKANAVIAKANGLLSNFQSIQKDALSAAANADQMKSDMATNPTWQLINGSGSNWQSALGWGSIQAGTNLIGQAVSLTQQLATIKGRCDDHLAAVDALKGIEDDLENFASGKGIAAAVSNLTGSFSGLGAGLSGSLTSIEYIALAVAGVYVLSIAAPFISSLSPRRKR